MTLFTRNAAIVGALDSVVDLADIGAGANATLTIYAGAVPADADAPLGGATTITVHDMSDPAFFGSIDANPGASSTADAVASATSVNVAQETATFFRIDDKDALSLYQGNVGTTGSGEELELPTTTIDPGVQIDINSVVATMPEQGT